VPVLRVRFGRVLRVTNAMWLAVDLGNGVLTERQIDLILKRGYARMRHYLTPVRLDPRSCPRAVRQRDGMAAPAEDRLDRRAAGARGRMNSSISEWHCCWHLHPLAPTSTR
jgi:hypothetical protein